MAMNDNARLAVERIRVQGKSKVVKIDKDIIAHQSAVVALEAEKARLLVEISDYDIAVPVEEIEAIKTVASVEEEIEEVIK